MHQDAGLVDFKLPASPDDKAAYRSWNQYKMIDLQLQYHIHWPNLEMWMNTKKPEWEEKIMWHYLSNMHCWATTNGFMFLGKVVFSKVLKMSWFPPHTWQCEDMFIYPYLFYLPWWTRVKLETLAESGFLTRCQQCLGFCPILENVKIYSFNPFYSAFPGNGYAGGLSQNNPMR